MLKNKFKRLFLILGVILSSTINTSCDKKIEETIVENKVFFSYMQVHHDDFDYFATGEYSLIHSYDELAFFVSRRIPEKYNDEFFKTNGLVLFKNNENDYGADSDITSYSIVDDTIIIDVITVRYTQAAMSSCWFYTLELSNERLNRVKNVIISKNGNQVIGQPIQTISEDEIIDSIKEAYALNAKWRFETEITADEVNVLYYFGRYNGYYVAIVEGDMPSEDKKTLVLGDLTFSFEKETISLYMSGFYYPLSTAYEYEYINHGELKKIYDKYQAIITK